MPVEMWVVFLACVAVGVWEALKSRSAAPSSEGAHHARRGKPPHPHAMIIDLPGGAMRLIDVRGLPVDDLRVAKLGLVQEQLLLERPIPAQIWVAPFDIVREWSQMSDVALVILNGRFRDSRDPGGRNFIYPFGGKLTDEEGHRLRLAGVDIVLGFDNLSNPPKTLDDFLEPPEVWRASPDDRPVPAHDVLSADPFDGRPVHIIEGFAFVDLRRLSPASWQTGVAVDRLEKLFPTLVADEAVSYVVWVVAPWVLERIDDSATTRIDRLVDSLPSRMQQRLALLVPANEPVGTYPFTTRMQSRLVPLTERLWWRTQDRGAFDVHPIEALHDAYFIEAWKLPSLS